MGQITFYLDEATEARLRVAVKQSGGSVSAWIAALVRDKTATQWPPGVAALAGAWPDFPEAPDVRREQGADTPRESW
ncbi:CopG family transcriptional regulator [Desulfovibrio sulfodismutans]|uniref:CopG family transcriptional regulator n=1 Tax=Desulfolutivibrio sulfodismutans TaxID=63561 RepID=A0A7K3NM99_9BACT|nr:CopG family transcriptional regulator [Desulfolutivibrio sulfodismutans]NDY57324.1 CopG family transcriptional regulator [Desulfolutivibrio sulfodismutans]QLA13934.1 CopG family transcriptional regulator [Desulfolutivibrio sulfodismutans DSM 3696]